MQNPVRETTLGIIEKAKHVKINHDAIKVLAKKWIKERIKVPLWSKKMHLDSLDEEQMLTYFFILDSLNFCFWPPKKIGGQWAEKWHVKYKREKHSGYFGLSIALKKFFEKHAEKANFFYLHKISFREFCEILGGTGELLFLKKRWEILKDLSSFMLKKYKGKPQKFMQTASGSLSKLVPKIQEELPGFRDMVGVGSKKIYFWKRAQILPIDIYAAFASREEATASQGRFWQFEDLDYATAFADYKIPQILRFWNILEYSNSLSKKVDNKLEIKAGSLEEIEIRAGTIWGVEYLKEELYKLGRRLHSFQIDWILWRKSREIKIDKPHHLTKTIFY